ncbi:MAG: outer membrane protein assembly factor BamA [Acidobacteria bacterium]|nr:outer membrane protein assembly factor BamA [Acidobacteriota bacterium]
MKLFSADRSSVRGRRFHSLLFCCLLLLSPGLLAQQASRERIEAVRIVGNRRIPESTIRFYITTKENDAYSEEQVLRDYRSLLHTNFFDDVTVKTQKGETGRIIIFEVRERPLIRAIEYQGMSSFKESDVLEKFRDMRVGLTVDSPFDPSRIPSARQALKLLLDMNGRPLGRVEMETEEITAAAIKLIFKIDEGPKVRIGDIQFEGNTVFEDDELREALKLTKERGPITLFKGQDKFIKEKLEYDVQVNLLARYREKGYVYARVGEPKVEIVEAPRGLLLGFRKTKQQYYITIPVEEGEQYRYGKFEVQGVKNFDQETVRKSYGIVEDEIANYTKLKESNDQLKKLYSRFGYLDMDLFPEIKPDPQTKKMDVTLRIEEGKQYIVNRIRFAGNTKTRDKVLRREFALEEQQQFNGDLLDYSVQRLNQLGFFEKIEEKDYEVLKNPQESEVDVIVKVKERGQQSIGLTGGVSGISGSFIGINYQSNNFRGLGQQIEVQLMAGTRTSNYVFSFTEPYFRDSALSLGLSVFNQRYRFDTLGFFPVFSADENISLFTRTSTGATISGSYPLWRWTRVGLQYSLQTIRIDDIDDAFRDFALNQLIGFTPGGTPEEAREGIIRSEVTPSFVYNSKDSFYGARRGTNLTIQVPVSGGPMGGDFSMIRPFVEYQKFLPDRLLSGGRNTFAFRAQVQYVWPFGRLPGGDPMTVPFFERIFSGGELTLRGFDIRSVAPWAITRTPRLDENRNPIVDPATGLPSITINPILVGGDTSLIFTGEYRIPIAGPLQLTGFADVGTSTILKRGNLQLFGKDTVIELLENTNNVWRASTGVEIQFLLPVINQPFRLIFAYNPWVLNTNVVLGGVRFPLREDRSNIKFTVGYSF